MMEGGGSMQGQDENRDSSAYLEIDYGNIRVAGVVLTVLGALVVVGWLYGGPSWLAVVLGASWLGLGTYLVAVSAHNPRIWIKSEGFIHDSPRLPWPSTTSIPFSSVRSVLLQGKGRRLLVIVQGVGGASGLRAFPLAKGTDPKVVAEIIRRKAPDSITVEFT